MIPTTHKQKVFLIFLGLFISVILLEVGLRLAGFIYISFQERVNRLSLQHKDDYVILCLGESTTAFGGNNSYPRQLENILNAADESKRFSVVNKGVPGTKTTGILATLDDNLKKYKPDLVVTMMGINDTQGTIAYKNTAGVKAKLLLHNFRVYKLIRLLYEHITYKLQEMKDARDRKGKESGGTVMPGKVSSLAGSGGSRKAIKEDRESEVPDLEKGDRYLNRDDWEEAIPIYEKALKLRHDNPEIMTKLGICYLELGRYKEAEELFEEALEKNSHLVDACIGLESVYLHHEKWKDLVAMSRKAVELKPNLAEGRARKYVNLARSFHHREDYAAAEEFYKLAIELYPRCDLAYAELGRFYNWRERRDEAITMCKKAIEINPRSDVAYAELGVLYAARGRWDLGEQMYKKALEIRPNNNFAFSQLSTRYKQLGKYREVEEMCRKVIEVAPENDRAWGALALCCEAQGKMILAGKYFDKANELRLKKFNPATARNYQQLKDKLDSMGIRLVCAQYPMRPLEHLQRMFTDKSGVAFVDNEGLFKEKVNDSDYGKYFEDNFAGDFGHCTPLGNRLLAEQIADVILQDVFGGSLRQNKGVSDTR